MLQTFILAEIVLFTVFTLILAVGLWSSYAGGTASTPTLEERPSSSA